MMREDWYSGVVCDLTEGQVPKLWVLYGEFWPLIYEFEGLSLHRTFHDHQMFVTSQGEVLAGSTLVWNGIVQQIPIPSRNYSFCPVRREFGFLQYHKAKPCFRTVPLTLTDGTQELCKDVAYDSVSGRTPRDSSFEAEDWIGGKWRVLEGEWGASLPYGSSSLQIQQNVLDLSNPTPHTHFKFTV